MMVRIEEYVFMPKWYFI